MKSLTKETVSGLRWSTLEQFLSKGLIFGIQILLARLIAPEEFGLLALVSIFILLSNVIISGGLGQALIQSRNISRLDISTVFFSNVVLAVTLYTILFFSAPLIADFYAEPRLVLLIRCVTLVLVVGSFGQIQNSLIVRELQFQKLFWITTPAILISGTVGIIMALTGFEVWALVGMQLVSAVMLTAGYWVFSNRQLWPQWEYSFSSLKRLGRFGSGIMGNNIMNQGVQSSYGLVISKSFSFGQLAFYNRARVFQRFPTRTFAQIIIRVMFPVFSRISDDNQRICRALRRGIPVIACVMFPAMALLMVAADHIIVFLLTDKWLPAAPLLRWFPIIGMLRPITRVYMSVLRGKGHSWLVFWLGFVKQSMAIGMLLITLKHGVLAIVIGQVIVAVVGGVAVNMPFTDRIVGYRLKSQLADILPYVMATALAGITSYFAGQWANLDSHFLAIVLQATVLFVVYGSLCVAFQLQGFLLARSYVLSAAKSAFLFISGRTTKGAIDQ